MALVTRNVKPDRKLDAIIAIDFSADGPSMYHGAYPNGTSLFNTYKKTQEEAYKNIHFPKIPEIDGPFTEKGLAKKPSFFGCHDQLAPIVIYLPNYFVVTDTNQATMKAEYSQGEIDAFFKNSFAIATQTRPGKGSNSFQYDNDSIQTLLGRAGPITHTRWKECLACALVDRQVTRNKMQRSPQCQRCFAKYCA
ncbi:Lysophospholipase 1 [Puccinia graminis f. sp. tritici]|uniref:Lysophospholipase n=1 Tax=Puccinia graminis f. sp. tritici TaxID=56615 RepID=A0A5B0NV61_PUCGR|nr:Lysophospholipase 1 [Puccinia graminis f. sp. tritici]